MVQIIWSSTAKNDLKSIYDYIAQNSSFYAQKTVLLLKQRTLILKKHPLIGKVVPEFEIETIRELIEGNYRIVYQSKNENLIQIITVFHTSRDMNAFKI